MQRIWLYFVVAVGLLVFSTSLVMAREFDPVWKAGKDGVGGDLNALGSQGQALFTSKGCTTCHTIGGNGGTIAPDLSSIGNARDLRYLKKWLRETHKVLPAAKMPEQNLAPDEINALAAYLSRQTK